LSQIGEFGFIFAGLAIATKVAGPELYAIAVGVCLVTSFTTPFLLKNHEKVSALFVNLIPESVGRGLNQYSATSRLVIASPQWRALATSYVIKILINSVIVVGLYLFAYYLLFPFLREELESRRWAQVITLFSMAVIASPFLWALVFSKSADEELNLFLKDRLSPRVRQSLFVLRAFWAFFLVTVMVAQFLSFKYVILFTFVLFVSFLFVLYKYLGRIYAMFEKRFLTQLNSPQNSHLNSADKASGRKIKAPVLAPWDAHLAQVTIPTESKFVGVPLLNLGLREKYGVIITAIERGDLFITAPNRDQMLMPLDRLYLIGTDEQLANFEKDLRLHVYPAGEQHEEMHLEALLLNEASPFIGKAIRDSGVREEFKGLVVGLERQGQRYLNPDSAMILEPGDLLWLVR
jgi:CPA2 family monovalent cation:H+ antiporter-2